MTRAEVTEKILTAKRLKELSWDEIAKKIGGASKIVVTAACLGQMKMTKEQAGKAAKLFGLAKEETLLLQEVPYRGSLPEMPLGKPRKFSIFGLLPACPPGAWRSINKTFRPSKLAYTAAERPAGPAPMIMTS